MKKSKYLLFFSMMFVLAGFVSLSFYDKGSVLNNLWQSNYITLCCKAFNTPILNVTCRTYVLYALLSAVILVASAICSYFGAKSKKHFIYCLIINLLVVILCNINTFRATEGAIFFIGGLATTLLLAIELAIAGFVIGVLFKPQPLKNTAFENIIMALITLRFGAIAVYLYDKSMVRPSIFNKYNFIQLYYTNVRKAEILNINFSAYLITAIVALVLLVSFVFVRHFIAKKQKTGKIITSLIYTLLVAGLLILMIFVTNTETSMAIKVFVVWGLLLTIVYALMLFFLRCVCQILFGQLNILTKDNCDSVSKDDAINTNEEDSIKTTDEPVEEAEAEKENEEESETETLEAEGESEEESETEPEEDEDEDDENNPVFTTEKRVAKSFKAKLILASDEVKNQYDVILNQINRYKKYSTRFSWSMLSVNIGRTKAMKINMSGKRMCVYFALDPQKYPKGNKYHLKNYGDKKKYEATPMRLHVSSNRALKYALELIDEVFTTNQIALKKVEPEHVDYKADLAPMSEEELVEAGLIKYRQVQVEVEKE